MNISIISIFLISYLLIFLISCDQKKPFPGPYSPTPEPTVSMSPAPSPTPDITCKLKDMPECGGPEGPAGVWGCCSEHNEPTFDAVIETAIERLQKQSPEIFNGERVKDEDAYMLGVVRILKSFGYCATRGGPGDEVGIKTSNAESEQFDILLANGSIRHHGFTVTCRPARF